MPITSSLRILGRAYTSLSVDFSVYVITPIALLFTALFFLPENALNEIRFRRAPPNAPDEAFISCAETHGMKVEKSKISIVEVYRTYPDEKCAALFYARNTLELGLRYRDKEAVVVALAIMARALPYVRQATTELADVMKVTSQSDLEALNSEKCRLGVMRTYENVFFGLRCRRRGSARSERN